MEMVFCFKKFIMVQRYDSLSIVVHFKTEKPSWLFYILFETVYAF